MFRGTTAWTMLAVVAAVLLALPFFAPTAPFAPAHAARHAEAKAEAGIKPSGTALRDEAVACPDADYVGGPGFPLNSLRQHRAADSAPQPSERPLLVAQDPAAAEEPAALSAGHHSLSRPSTAHLPAVLQVFRC